MLLELKIKNYRSIKEEAVFSMIAESYRSKDMNVFTQAVANDDSVRLLKTAAVWGANASGKTNVIRAMLCLIQLLENPPEVEKPIEQYDPFQFANDTEHQPVALFLSFIGPNQIRFEYQIAFNKVSIVEETLSYYPNGKKKECFHRSLNKSKKIDEGVMGSDWKKKTYNVYKNQLFLSQFGKNIADETLGSVYSYLTGLRVVNTTDSNILQGVKRDVSKKLLEKPVLLQRLNKLITQVDIRVEALEIKEIEKEAFQFSKELPSDLVEKLFNQEKYQVFGKHKYYENGVFQRMESLHIAKESHGTQNLFALGGYLFDALDEGAVVFIDELDTSLHPFVAKLIIELFQNEQTNPHHAQLIFTTHDTSLLDETMLRRDQVWFTEKDAYGATELYSLQDIEGVREDSLFEKGYRAGKYKAIPKIPSLDYIFAA
jgi:AAA15 family ATPase/GTPase